MKILILEDSILRMNYFRKKFKNDEIIHTDSAHKAIEYIKENDFDVILLDHDLGGEENDYDPTNCGGIVAEYLKENPVKSQILIHSYNEPASRKMLSLINGSVWVPGIWFDH